MFFVEAEGRGYHTHLVMADDVLILSSLFQGSLPGMPTRCPRLLQLLKKFSMLDYSNCLKYTLKVLVPHFKILVFIVQIMRLC